MNGCDPHPPQKKLPSNSEFCEIFKNTYIGKHLRMAVCVYCRVNINLEKNLVVSDLFFIHLVRLCPKQKNTNTKKNKESRGIQAFVL